jgi:ATP-dependent Clp protease protease subunit
MASLFTLNKEEENKPAEAPSFAAIPQALFKSRTVLIFGEVDMKMAERVTANLLALRGG